MQTHPQERRVFLEVFLTQRVSAYRFHESLNLGLNKNGKIIKGFSIPMQL